MNKKQTISFSAALFLSLPFFVLAAPNNEAREARQTERQDRMEARQEVRTQKQTEQKEQRAQKEADRTEKKEAREALACENITERLGERQARFTEQKGELQSKKTERSTERLEKRTERDQTLSAKRAAATERRAKMYQNLLNKATTEEEKAAVAAFKSTVESAVVTRQAAIDQAMKSFRASADALHTEKKDTRSASLVTFQAAVSSALDTAKASCADGVSSQEVRSTYQQSVQAARAAVKVARPANQGLGEEMSALAKTRNLSIRQAIADYRATLESALSTLKAALGPDSIEPSENEQ